MEKISIIRKNGVKVLTESVLLEDEEMEVANAAGEEMSSAVADFPKETDGYTAAIINLRDGELHHLYKDIEHFKGEISGRYGAMTMTRKTTLCEATRALSILNLVLGSDYALTDLYLDAEVSSEQHDGGTCIVYTGLNVDLIVKFREKLDYICDLVYGFLNNPAVEDREALMKYVSTIAGITALARL